jgi:hypothetical protein
MCARVCADVTLALLPFLQVKRMVRPEELGPSYGYKAKRCASHAPHPRLHAYKST